MGTASDIGQTVKGKAQQIKGTIEQSSGQGVKGGISKIKGKTNEIIGRGKLRSRSTRRYL